MKKKKILALTTVIALSTTTLAFANEIKMVEKNGQDYVPFKTLVKTLGGEIKETKEELKVNVNSKKLTIQTETPFIKVNENYYPLEEKEMNGYKIPIDTKPTYEDKELYVSTEFLKNANIVNFDIEDGKLIINNTVEKETTSSIKEEIKKETIQKIPEEKKEEPKTETQEKPQNTVRPTKPNRPNNNNRPPSNNNNNSNNNNSNKPDNNQNNSSNNNSNNNDSNNGSSEDNNNSESNNGSNNEGNNSNDNSQNNDSQTNTEE